MLIPLAFQASPVAVASPPAPTRLHSLKRLSRRTSSPPLTPTQPGSKATIPSSWARRRCLRAFRPSPAAAPMENLNSARIRQPIPHNMARPFANFASSGMGYASFLLGLAGGLEVAPPETGTRLGMHSYSLYLQDSWKVTHTLTVELGSALGLREPLERRTRPYAERRLHRTEPNPRRKAWHRGIRNQPAIAPSPVPTGFSIGPHVGVAWQITPKTVFRAGGAINYAAGADQAGLNVSVPDFLSLGSPGYGLPSAILKNGDPYAPGNVYGNPVLTFNSFYNPNTPQYPAPAAPGVVPPSSPFISIASNAARLPRIFQWSIGFQRETFKGHGH